MLGQGVRPTAKTPASPHARYYARSKGVISDHPGSAKRKTAACGFGVTAVTRLGAPGFTRAVPAVITAIAFGPPTSGSVDAAAEALDAHARNGHAPAPTRKGRPLLVVDKGYNPKGGWARMCLERNYHWLGRYISTTRNKFLSQPARWSAQQDQRTPGGPGPVLLEGAFYCPAVLQLPPATLAVATRDIQSWSEHDARVRARLPFLMGTNDKMTLGNRKTGRPRAGAQPERVMRQPLQCPADQGRVACPLRPDSQRKHAAPRAKPVWDAEHYDCCHHSQVTVTLTRDQEKAWQGGPPPGSWEHAMVFESFRAITESRFELVKSPVVAALEDVKVGPRREVWHKLTVGMAIVVANITVQRDFTPRAGDASTRWRDDLRSKLGHEPAVIPART